MKLITHVTKEPIAEFEQYLDLQIGEKFRIPLKDNQIYLLVTDIKYNNVVVFELTKEQYFSDIGISDVLV